MSDAVDNEVLSPLDEFIKSSRSDLEKTRANLKEIDLLIEQSQGEVDKLVQRSVGVTGKLHQIQAQFDTIPREDIRSVYEDAQDNQQRLFSMRGQLDKLQSDRENLKIYADYIGQALVLFEGGPQVQPENNARDAKLGIESIIEAQEEERRRISRQIHDGPAQALSNFILQSEIAFRLFDRDTDKARQELQALKDNATETFSEVRDFIFDLRPMMLDDLGLIPTVRRYSEAFKDKTGLDIALVVTGMEQRLAPYKEVLAFRTIQGLLANVRDHAQATQVKINLHVDEEGVKAVVENNGKGFDIEALWKDEEKQQSSLCATRNRLGQIGGTFEISSPPEGGIRAAFTIPSEK
jgi:two-component system sensor histidine kinase DegS